MPLSQRETAIIDANTVVVSINISLPVKGKDNYYCLVDISPFLPSGIKIYGADAENAARCALSFAEQMLEPYQFKRSHDTE